MAQESKICDECADAAEDLGAATLAEREMVCTNLGRELMDHLCEVVEEPEAGASCACNCH